MKTGFQRKIALLAVGLGLSMFCFSCATAPPKSEETSPAPKAESPVAQDETPRLTPIPAREPAQEAQPVPEKKAPAVQEPPPPVMKTKPRPVFYPHTVKYSGETLSVIALWYTGSHGNWKEIAQANPDLNPNRIFPGDEILIPEGLLRTRTPLSKEFVERINAKTKKEKPKANTQAKPVPPQQEEPKLFGPKKTTPK